MERLLISLAAILIWAKVAALLSRRVGLPGVFGELVLGLALGPSLLSLIDPSESVMGMAEVGALVLLFIAGMETDLIQMRQVGVPSSLAALGGVVLPFAGGAALARAYGFELPSALFVGAILTATSVSISVQTLSELGKLQSREGSAILSAAIIDDVLGVMVLSLVIILGSHTGNVFVPFLSMGLFFLVAIVLGGRFLADLVGRSSWVEPKEARLAIVMAIVLASAWGAQVLGKMAAITGAYLAGVLVARTHLRQETLEGIAALGYGFFVPIFFVSIGLQADVRGFLGVPLFAGLLLAIAVVGKVVGCSLGAWLGRFGLGESLRVGVGMISRGEVALVIAAIGLHSGLIDSTLFSAAVAMTLATTLMTPPLLKAAYALGGSAKLPEGEAVSADAFQLASLAQLAQSEEVVTLQSPGDRPRGVEGDHVAHGSV